MTHIAVIDVGKTNAKLALVDSTTLEEIAVVTRPNRVLTDGPYPHFDLEGHWAFFVDALGKFQSQHGVDAISVTTHGAAVTLIDHDGQAIPMLDYEFGGLDPTGYDVLRPEFSETGSPRLSMGLNAGAQLHWLFTSDPTLRDRVASIVTYPQYWGFRLTGQVATDVTSLGCHTDLWNPHSGQYSQLVNDLGIADLIAPARKSTDILGTILPAIAEQTGISASTPVVCGIHDSNASLYPYLLGAKGPFSVVSTGTWVVCMSMGDTVPELDPTRDTLINVNALGNAVPTARFMGGREFELISAGRDITTSDADREAVLNGIHLLPAVEPTSGPFMGRKMKWSVKPATAGQEMIALSYYLALMTDTCLSLINATGDVIVEGPFGRNDDYLQMLAALRSNVRIAASATGTSVGAALLAMDSPKSPETSPITSPVDDRFTRYALEWARLLKES
ncbi:carbohydrate kinase [Marivivens niveibacter]|uniref:Carbohydrate kinase n=1 Tax=Marivivens niveibacter TaxID=1930667 RepID=A0A251WWM0_9RHOB|nr:FGGY-family carbohydrate kinase [Marivivens niveibacter]OUD08363.1 carbohydrate kinase [Marivivens niveibacter]